MKVTSLLGGAVFSREVLAHSRRTRTYVFQTIFLTILVVALIPLWPSAGANESGAAIADRGRAIFEYGGYLQLLLLALLAPAATANAITEEKEGGTIDLLLLTGAGPFVIVWGKFFSRLYNLSFLLFLTVPLLFALLTLGGVGASAIGVELMILATFAVFASGLGIFLSTILPKAPTVLMAGYLVLALILALPIGLEQFGVTQAKPGTFALLAAHVSPFFDLIYLFQPSRFVSSESFPSQWYVVPVWMTGAGVALVCVAGLLLPRAAQLERLMSMRRLLEAFDRATYLLLRPRKLLLRIQGRLAADEGKVAEAAARRSVGNMNAIYWKETNVNTIGRFKHWWRANLAVLALMVVSYGVFANVPGLNGQGTILADIEFHRYMVATITGVLVLLTTVIAATTVSQEREDSSLVLLATTPIDCPTYVRGKVQGIARNIVFLVGLPFLHIVIFVAAGVIHPVTIVYMLISIPLAVVAMIMQGIFVSLLFSTTLRAILAAIVLLCVQAALPLVCCLPTFNVPLTAYFMVEPVSGLSSIQQVTNTQTSYLWAMLLALVFSAGTQLGYTVVVFSLIRSGFDRYIGRAA